MKRSLPSNARPDVWFPLLFAFFLLAGCFRILEDQRSEEGNDDLWAKASGDAGDAGDGGNLLGTKTDKLDLLFAIDNSKQMGDKQELLRLAIPKLIGRLLRPNCIDSSRLPLGSSAVGEDGAADCSAFPGTRAEFRPVHDMHVGVITSSLGPRGSDECRDRKNPSNPALDSHNNDRAHLINRGGAGEAPVVPHGSSNYLAWLPRGHSENGGRSEPPGGVIRFEEEAAFVTAFGSLVSGVKEYGCGYEAQLESVYRFLVQPDPYKEIVLTDPDLSKLPRATLVGVDETILKQRKDFLRPDSLVAVVLVTDENESTVDPLALDGRGWIYLQSNHVKGGTPECATDPNSKACTSCYLIENGPRCPDGNYLSDRMDPANLRFVDMKRRFGVDPRFPVRRYAEGFTRSSVPDRRGEHPADGRGGAYRDYVGSANCTNPLFAASLPASGNVDTEAGKDALCNLPKGPRTPDQIVFAVMGGVPWQLLTDKPEEMSNSNHGSYKRTLDRADWIRILGRDPDSFDRTGISPFMIESALARAGIATPNEVNLGEWNTKQSELQYACTFSLQLSGPVSRKTCTNPSDDACPCFRNSAVNVPLRTESPICARELQVAARANPSIRALQVARDLGGQSIVGSICPRTLDGIPEEEAFGYNPTMQLVIDRLSEGLVSVD
ncbi:MAG: hypothetical protein KBF88_13995 [Polyangiaceae bacterium]|nr:hypothetical protein [Polyangiaceae bacterium]